MKKLFTTNEYKTRQKRRLKKLNRRGGGGGYTVYGTSTSATPFCNTQPLESPSDLSVYSNLRGCLTFFSYIREKVDSGSKRIVLCLKMVTNIDYASVSILRAITDELDLKKVLFKCNLPKNQKCKQFLKDSGFLEERYNLDGKLFPRSKDADLLFFETGTIVKTGLESNIDKAVGSTVEHFTGTRGFCPFLRTALLEICGNAREWSESYNKQWILGIKYEEERVIFTVTDIGTGILASIKRRFRDQLGDLLTLRSDKEILARAFDKKYSSKSEKPNRNKGLPFIKRISDEGLIGGLWVLTNNVLLSFDNDNTPVASSIIKNRFDGTFYRWVVTKDCLDKKQGEIYET